MNRSLAELVRRGEITVESAYLYSLNPKDPREDDLIYKHPCFSTTKPSTTKGARAAGSIDAVNVDVAIAALQRRGLIIVSIDEAGEARRSLLTMNITFFDHVSNKDVVILSRQLSTLFEAQVSALRIFRLLGRETENNVLGAKLLDDAPTTSRAARPSPPPWPSIRRSSPISTSTWSRPAKNPASSTRPSLYLADYLDRTYELTSKAKSALIYPAFVMVDVLTVMILMFTVVIPKIAGHPHRFRRRPSRSIPRSSSAFQQFPRPLRLRSSSPRHRRRRSSSSASSARRRASWPSTGSSSHVPYVSTLYRKLYLSRLADNMNTMLTSGIPMVRALELTSSVIDNQSTKDILDEAIEAVKGGKAVSEALSGIRRNPGIMIQMMKVGEESGELGHILKTMATFYTREVINAVDTLVST